MEHVWYDVLLNSFNGYTLNDVPDNWKSEVEVLIKNAFKNGNIDKTKYNIMMGHNKNNTSEDYVLDTIDSIISEYL